MSNYAVQLAAILGGHVTATGHARQRDFVLSLGASAFLASGSEEGQARYPRRAASTWSSTPSAAPFSTPLTR
jgi:hypothetical protein